MSIKLIGFDLDDTLWHAEPVLLKAEQELQRWIINTHPKVAALCSIEQFATLRNKLEDPSRPRAEQVSELRKRSLQAVAMNAGYDRNQASLFAARAMDLFLFWRSEFVVSQDTQKALATLAKNYTLVAISNGNAQIHQSCLNHYFSLHLSAETAQAAKPKPDMLNSAAARFKVSSNECVYVGDSEKYDQTAARAAGWHFCKIDAGRNADINRISELANWLKLFN